MDIPNLELNEWLKELKPYQKEIMEQLIEKFGEDGAIEKWLLANGPSNTIKFGGDKTCKPFLDRFKEEFTKFICGHEDYLKEQTQLAEQGEVTRTMLVGSISGLIGSKLGVATTVIAPVVVISLFTLGKIGRKAYCSEFEKCS